MVAADLCAVVNIEQGSHQHPWSRPLFERELDNPLSTLFVALDGDVIVGYLCVWLVAGEAEIHNVATDVQHQRRGVGTFLLNEVFQWLRTEGVERVLLEVRASNVAAIQLYQRWGFETSSCRKGYYQDGEDALLMHRDLAESL